MLDRSLGDVPVAAVPVVPAVELVPEVEDEPVLGLAFVRMNDAPAPVSEPVLDAVEPVLDVPLVPVAPLASPRCRHPVTVIVPLWVPDLGVVCGLLLCAATMAAHPNPIATVAATRFIDASFN